MLGFLTFVGGVVEFNPAFFVALILPVLAAAILAGTAIWIIFSGAKAICRMIGNSKLNVTSVVGVGNNHRK